MLNPEELKIKQLDGSVEKFFIVHANKYLQEFEEKASPGEHKYRVYKHEPITGFSIEVREGKTGLYVKHISCNSSDCVKKNIVFEALCFISDQHRMPIFSSLKDGHHNGDELDRLIPGTMGKRWDIMLNRHPDRVQLLANGSRYVLSPKQA